VFWNIGAALHHLCVSEELHRFLLPKNMIQCEWHKKLQKYQSSPKGKFDKLKINILNIDGDINNTCLVSNWNM
jgi:hypothetical protein